jgi:hypothetical protein
VKDFIWRTPVFFIVTLLSGYGAIRGEIFLSALVVALFLSLVVIVVGLPDK